MPCSDGYPSEKEIRMGGKLAEAEKRIVRLESMICALGANMRLEEIKKIEKVHRCSGILDFLKSHNAKDLARINNKLFDVFSHHEINQIINNIDNIKNMNDKEK